MNPSHDPSHEANPEEGAETSPRGTREALDDLSRSLTEAIQRGGRDARRKFEESMPKAKEEFAKGLHDLAYAIAYATTFGGSLLREVTPDALRDGFREGSASGRRAADEVMRQRREKAEREARQAGQEGSEGAWA